MVRLIIKNLCYNSEKLKCLLRVNGGDIWRVDTCVPFKVASCQHVDGVLNIIGKL